MIATGTFVPPTGISIFCYLESFSEFPTPPSACGTLAIRSRGLAKVSTPPGFFRIERQRTRGCWQCPACRVPANAPHSPCVKLVGGLTNHDADERRKFFEFLGEDCSYGPLSPIKPRPAIRPCHGHSTQLSAASRELRSPGNAVASSRTARCRLCVSRIAELPAYAARQLEGGTIQRFSHGKFSALLVQRSDSGRQIPTYPADSAIQPSRPRADC